MSIALQKATGKPIMPIRYTPSRQEGQYIRYRLRLVGENFVNIARRLNLSQTNIDKVVYGHRRSARIEAEIARILGKASWNDVVLEARSEIRKKPVDVIIKELQRETEARSLAEEKRRAEIAERVDGQIEAGLAAMDPKKRKRLERKAGSL